MTKCFRNIDPPRPQLGTTFNDGRSLIEVRAICHTHIVVGVTDQHGNTGHAIYKRAQFANQFMEGA